MKCWDFKTEVYDIPCLLIDLLVHMPYGLHCNPSVIEHILRGWGVQFFNHLKDLWVSILKWLLSWLLVHRHFNFFMSSNVEFWGGFAIVELIGGFKKRYSKSLRAFLIFVFQDSKVCDVSPSLSLIFPSVVVTPKQAYHYFFNAEQSKSYGRHAFWFYSISLEFTNYLRQVGTTILVT